MDRPRQAVSRRELDPRGVGTGKLAEDSTPANPSEDDGGLHGALIVELAERRAEVRERDLRLAQAWTDSLRTQAMLSDLSSRLGEALALAAQERSAREGLQQRLDAVAGTRAWRVASLLSTAVASGRRRVAAIGAKLVAPFRRSR